MNDNQGMPIYPKVNQGELGVVSYPRLPDALEPARDLDRNGILEDVNGNGHLDIADPLILYLNLDSGVVQDHVLLFDHNNDNRVDLADVIALVDLLWTNGELT